MILEERCCKTSLSANSYNHLSLKLHQDDSDSFLIYFFSDGKKIFRFISNKDNEILIQQINLLIPNCDKAIISALSGVWISFTCIFLYVVTVPLAYNSEARRCHIYLVVFDPSNETTNVEVKVIQTTPITYYPFAATVLTSQKLSKISFFLSICGSDNNIHFYEIDEDNGGIYRSPVRDEIKDDWEFRLGTKERNSLPLHIHFEPFDYGCQGLLCYLDGHFCWTSEKYVRTQSEEDFYYDSTSSFGNVNPTQNTNEPNQKTIIISKTILLDSFVTSVYLYTLKATSQMNNNAITNRFNPDNYTNISKKESSSHIIVGQSNGLALLFPIFLLNTQSVPAPTVITYSTNRDDPTTSSSSGAIGGESHGAVLSVASGRISLSNYQDIILGYKDGVIVVLMPEDTVEEGLLDSDRLWFYPLESRLRFVPIWSTQLSFPIYDVKYGHFFHTVMPSLSTDGTLILPCDQMVVVTERSVHIFTHPGKREEEGCEKGEEGIVENHSEEDPLLRRLFDIQSFLSDLSSLAQHLEQNQASLRGLNKRSASNRYSVLPSKYMDVIPEVEEEEVEEGGDGDENREEGKSETRSDISSIHSNSQSELIDD